MMSHALGRFKGCRSEALLRHDSARDFFLAINQIFEPSFHMESFKDFNEKNSKYFFIQTYVYVLVSILITFVHIASAVVVSE